MTTPQADGEQPTDMADPAPEPGSGSNDENDEIDGDDSRDTDPMGIDENDPIDATLVGGPVDDSDGSPDADAASDSH